MSTEGMTRTILATGLQTAIRKDERDGHVINVYGKGKLGPAVSAWIAEVAKELDARKVGP